DPDAGPGALGALLMLEHSRPAVAAGSIGIARAAYEFALDYAQQRVAFGKPIIKHEGIGFKLAEMAINIDAARLLTWRAGWMAQNDMLFTRAEGSMAKAFAADMAMQVTLDAVQVRGGDGRIPRPGPRRLPGAGARRRRRGGYRHPDRERSRAGEGGRGLGKPTVAADGVAKKRLLRKDVERYPRNGPPLGGAQAGCDESRSGQDRGRPGRQRIRQPGHSHQQCRDARPHGVRREPGG